MVDMIDKANADYEFLLQSQIRKIQQPPNDITDFVDCGEPIGEKRKQVLPHAVRCVVCQQQREQKNE